MASSDPDTSDKEKQEAVQTPPVLPLPWYRRPLFWGLLFSALILTLLSWILWKQWQIAEALKQEALAAQQAQLAEQQHRNNSLAEEIARLRGWLDQTPCEVKALLTDLPSTATSGGSTPHPGTTQNNATPRNGTQNSSPAHDMEQNSATSPGAAQNSTTSPDAGSGPTAPAEDKNSATSPDASTGRPLRIPEAGTENSGGSPASPDAGSSTSSAPDTDTGPTPPSSAQNSSPAQKTEQNTAPQTPPGVNAKLEQATALILVPLQGGIGMGSGFFISPDTLVTNQHVVGNARTAIIAGQFSPVPLKAAVAARSTAGGRDFAVLRLEKPVSVTPLSFASARVKRTTKISAWGFPGAVTTDDPAFKRLINGDASARPEVVYTEGVVSVVQERTPPLIVHTATVSQGSSGGPLVNEQGGVVGINTYIRLDDESYRQSSLAIVAETLMEYLKQNGFTFSVAGGRP